jgi:DNA-binding response OmpR family regulator
MAKILIIEDDFYVRNLYKTAFEMAGYQVDEAGGGESGIDKVMHQQYEFILLDLMLPKIPGLQVLKQIRNLTDRPVYVLTNVGDENVLQEAIKEGAQAYFMKVDYTPKQLITALQEKHQGITKQNQ